MKEKKYGKSNKQQNEMSLNLTLKAKRQCDDTISELYVDRELSCSQLLLFVGMINTLI